MNLVRVALLGVVSLGLVGPALASPMLDLPAPTAQLAPIAIDDAFTVGPTEFARTDDELVLARDAAPFQSVALVGPLAVVPEPATLLLLGSALAVTARRCRRR